MSAQGLFSIGGIASGLDTENIVSQLMKLERQPMQKIAQRQDDLRGVKDAWGKVNTKLSSLRTAIDGIARPDRFDRMVAVSSSNPDAVSVETTGTTGTGTQSFTVKQLATRQQTYSGERFASRDTALETRTLEIHVGNADYDFTADLGPDATLDDLVAAVNDAGIGVRASALQVAEGDVRLVLDAEDAGTANAFSLTATGWDLPFTTTDAEDAILQVGAIEVTRSSNTIDDLVDGATITLKQTTTQEVIVTAERDVDAAVDSVKNYVEALNGALKTIKEMTAYNSESGKAGPLQGQYTANTLAMSLRSAASTPVVGLDGTAGLPSSVGISLTRDGMVTFDEAAARQAFTNDFSGAAKTLARAGYTTDPAATYLNGASPTEPGTYEVQVTQAADVARVTGSTYAPPTGDPKIFRISRPGKDPVTVTLAEGTSLANAVNQINAALREANVTSITAREATLADGTQGLHLEEDRFGSAYGFTVEELVDETSGEVLAGGQVFGLEGSHFGVDVTGTIDGQAATGRGRTLTAAVGPADGLSVRIEGQPDAFEITYSRGVVGQVGNELAKAEGIEGTVARARASLDSQIGIYQSRLESFERRLETREATIRRQFVGMESMLQKLNSQGDWMAQQLQSLNSLKPQK